MNLRAVAASLALLVATPAHADDHTIPGHAIDRPVTGAVIGLAFGGQVGASLIPMREAPTLWQRRLWVVDAHAHDNLAPRAAMLGDGLLAASIAEQVMYLTGTSIEDADQRPRPSLFRTSAAAKA